MTHTIGNRVGAKRRCSFINEYLHEYYAPMIEVDGRKMFVKDDSTKSGMMEAPTRQEALKMAREVRDRNKSKMLLEG